MNAQTGKLYVYGNKSGYGLSPRYVVGKSRWVKYVLTSMGWDKYGRKEIVARIRQASSGFTGATEAGSS